MTNFKNKIYENRPEDKEMYFHFLNEFDLKFVFIFFVRLFRIYMSLISADYDTR